MRTRIAARAATCGSAVGLVLVIAVAAQGGLSFLWHTSCIEQKFVGEDVFWTPWELVNAPYLGSTVWGGSFHTWGLFGSTHVVLTDGNLSGGNLSTGYFETQNWTVSTMVNQTVLGPGVDHRCSSAFAVNLAHTRFDVSIDGIPLQGPGNTSNSNEPKTFNDSGPQLAATFANGFTQANAPSITTCGAPGKHLNVSSASFEVAIQMPSLHGPVPVTFSIASLENFTYYFPPGAGTWQVDNLSAPGGPGGGWAFSFVGPCG
jgi:hypothetical protein